MGAFAKRLRPRKLEHVAPSQRFARWGRLIVARPWLAAGLGTLVLLLLATPFAGLRLGQPDDGNDRAATTTRQAYDHARRGLRPRLQRPARARRERAGERGRRAPRSSACSSAVAADPGVAAAAPAQVQRGARRRDAQPSSRRPRRRTSARRSWSSGCAARCIPRAVDGSGVEVHVGGATATFDDLADKIASRLPIFIALVVGLSVLLLMAVFRSLWVPLVSAAFNVLSILAAYGVVVAVFQWGWGASLLGVDGEVPIVSFVPLFMFAILFGLSMDYNVFLQSRIREEYHRGLAPKESVVVGLSRVGRVILAAGAIMTAVFLGFVSDPDVVVKTIGLGLASAILIDVLVVRMVVAPAVMALLGDRAWGLPGWLDRLLPRISLEGEELGASSGRPRSGLATA